MNNLNKVLVWDTFLLEEVYSRIIVQSNGVISKEIIQKDYLAYIIQSTIKMQSFVFVKSIIPSARPKIFSCYELPLALLSLDR